MSIENLPQWFLDLYLDFRTGISDRKDSFEKCNSAVIRDEDTAGEVKTGYAIKVPDKNEITFAGIRKPDDPEKDTEYCHLKTKYEHGTEAS